MKYYRILSDPKCKWSGCLLVFMVAALIPLALGSFIITKTRDTAGVTGLVLMYVGAAVISIAIGCLLVVLYKKIESKVSYIVTVKVCYVCLSPFKRLKFKYILCMV